MSDPLEGMPLDELPDMPWHDFALAASLDKLPSLASLLLALPSGDIQKMRMLMKRIWPRLLYTTLQFSNLSDRSTKCAGCSAYWTNCRSASARRNMADALQVHIRKLREFCALCYAARPASKPVAEQLSFSVI